MSYVTWLTPEAIFAPFLYLFGFVPLKNKTKQNTNEPIELLKYAILRLL